MHVFGGQYREHTGRRLRRFGVDRPENRMRVRRAQHHGMRQARKCEIVEKASRPVMNRKSSRRLGLSPMTERIVATPIPGFDANFVMSLRPPRSVAIAPQTPDLHLSAPVLHSCQ